MQLTKGAIGNLINRYKAVLKKCHLMNTFGSLAVAGMLVMGGAGVAGAAITTGQDFQDAVTKAKPGDTIMLGQDIKEGLGAVFKEKTVTVDFGGHTYTGYSGSVGSTGTETQLFQLLKESPAVTLKNGILNIATPTAESGKFKMVLQNYCNLTLENMVVDGSNLQGNVSYTMSNNHGDITINNSTIIAKKGGVAFDVYYWPKGGYSDGVSVTVNNSTINGKIEVTVDGSASLKDRAKHQLTLTGGTLTGGLTAMQGAQLYNEGTTVISNVAMAGNTATDKGGAIFNSDDKTGAKGDLTLNNVDLKGNKANFGGAIWNEGTLTVNGGSFEGNTAKSAAGAIYNAAGATLTVDDVTFASNSSAIAGAINNSDGTVTIKNSTFKGNDAGKSMGGAVRNNSGSAPEKSIITITGSTFEGNKAGKTGGAIFNATHGKLDFNGTNTFTNNTAAGNANDIYNAGTIKVADGTTTLNSGLILAANSTTNVSGGALVINGTTTWEKGEKLGSLKVGGGALTLQKGDVLEGYVKAKEGTSLSVDSGALYLINKENYTVENFTAAKMALLKNANASFGFVGGQLVDEDNKVTDLVVSGNTIDSTTTFKENTVLADTTVDNSSFLENDLKVEAGTNAEVTINGADVAVNKVNIGTSATGDKSLTINNNGSLTVVGGNANDKLIAANGTDDLTTINVYEGKLNLGSAAMPERGAGTLGAAEIVLGDKGSLNASNGDYTVGDVTGTGEVTANTGANLNTGKIEAKAVTADAANIKATGDVTADGIDLVKGGSVTSDKNITVSGPIDDADGTLRAGGNISAAGQNLTQAAGGKLTVAAGGTIEAANISATNVAAKKLTASGDVAVDGGVLNLTGTGTATADASTVDSLTLTNGTQADIAGSLQLAPNSTLTVGTDDDTVGGTTLSAQHIDLNGGMLLVDPAWGLASSNVAVKDLSALGGTSADPTLVNGSVGVGQNSYMALRTDDLTWLPGVVGNYTKGVGLSKDGITAALGVFDSIKIADTKGLVVDGSLTNTGLSAAIDPNTAKFGANSLLVVNGANIYGDKAAISFAAQNGGTLTVAEGAKLVVTDAVAGETYTIVDNIAANPNNQNKVVWKTEGLSTTTDMISLGDAKYDADGKKVTTASTLNNARDVFPNLSEGMTNAVNDLYATHKGADGKPWNYADVDSDQMGVRFLSRATDNRFLGMDKEAAAESIESAARIAFAGAAPQMTKMASDAGTNAVVNRLGFANPADGAQAMDAEGKIVDRNTTGFALWIAPLWQSQHGWGLDAGNMDYGFNGNLGGVSLGADYTFENAIRAGITFNIGGGYAESSGGDLSSTDNRMNFWGLGAYAGWNYENFGVMADVSYTSTWNQLKQDLDSRLGMGNKLEADVQASAISAGLRAEYLLQTSAMDIIPHIGVRYMSLNTWGYDVDTHGGTVLEGDSLHQDIWTFPIGVTFTKDFALDSGWNFKPSLDFSVIPAAGDIKAKHDVHFTGLPGTYEVETQMMDYLTWQGGVGLELANDNMSIGVNYTLQAGQHTTGHGVFGSFRYEF